MFSTKARELTPKTTVHDVLMGDKVIATCGYKPAADSVCATFEKFKVVNMESFKQLPNNVKIAFVSVTSMSHPSF